MRVTYIYTLWLLENFGRMDGLLSCEVCFFRVLRHKGDKLIMRTDVIFVQERVYDCGYRKRGKQSVHVQFSPSQLFFE